VASNRGRSDRDVHSVIVDASMLSRELLLALLDERTQHRFQSVEPSRQLVSLLGRFVRSGGERRVVLPPVDPHLARLVDRGNQQADLDLKKLDLAETQCDVAGDDDPLVQHSLQQIGEVGRSPLWYAGKSPALRASAVQDSRNSWIALSHGVSLLPVLWY
jgi:hypothetical protein